MVLILQNAAKGTTQQFISNKYDNNINYTLHRHERHFGLAKFFDGFESSEKLIECSVDLFP